MEFQHPTSDYTETCSSPWLWTLLFGFFYFAVKGVWRHALISIVACVITAPTVIGPLFVWIGYTIAAKDVVRKSYLRKGWTEIIPLTEQV